MIDGIRLHFKLETIVGQSHVREAHSYEALVGFGVSQIMGDMREPCAARPKSLDYGKCLFDGLVHGMRNIPQRIENEFVEIFQQGHGRVWNLAEISEISGAAEAEAENFHISMKQRDRNERDSQKLARAHDGVQCDTRDGTERRFVIEDVGKNAADGAKGLLVAVDGQG